MGNTVQIQNLASAINDVLDEYSALAAEDLKTAVTNAGKTVKKEIEKTAPKRTGKYKKSWRVKKSSETSQSVSLVVHSPTRYMLTHLLEHGHAKRGGGRVRAIPHIAPAEAVGEEQLMKELERRLQSH